MVTAFHVGVDLFGLKAFEVAYRHGAAYVDELNQYLYENAQFVAEYVAENLPAARHMSRMEPILCGWILRHWD